MSEWADIGEIVGMVAVVITTGGEKLSKARWEELKYGFDPTFWQHVGNSLYTAPE